MKRPTILEARDIHKVYPIGRYSKQSLHVLKGIDLQVRRGEIVVMVGASGAGKSTLLHILGALDRPTDGKVLHNGFDVFSLSDEALARFRNKEVGFVFQFHHLLPEFTAVENVAMPMMIMGRRASESKKKAGKLLQKVGLGERADHRPSELSGGEQQRVAVARALTNDPSIVLGDEPSGNLDSANAAVLHDFIWALSREEGLTFVIVTHNERLSERADRVFRIEDGKLRVNTETGNQGGM